MTPSDLQALSRKEALHLIADALCYRMMGLSFGTAEREFLNRIVHMIWDMEPPTTTGGNDDLPSI